MRVDSIVTWRWHTPGYRSQYPPETVNTLRRMFARHYPTPHRFLCVTDDVQGLDPQVEVIPPWDDYADLVAYGAPRNPNCYRRLRMFDPAVGAIFGSRYLSIDLDVVLLADVTPILDRPEPIVLWGNTHPTTHYNGSMVLLSAGARPEVWTTFDPATSPARARAAKQMGSDQGWFSYVLGPGEARWTTADGVYSFRNDIRPTGTVPSDARLIVCHGQIDPWMAHAQQFPWVQAHYR